MQPNSPQVEISRLRAELALVKMERNILGKATAYFAKAAKGSVALATNERDFGRDECHFLKLDGFALPMYKIGRQKTSRCSPPS